MTIKRMCTNITVYTSTLAKDSAGNLLNANPTGTGQISGPVTFDFGNTTGWSAWGLVGRLSDLPQVGDLTSLFDEYRIRKIVYNIVPAQNTISSSTSVAPIIYTTLDSDGGFQHSSENDMLQYDACRLVKNALRPFSVTVNWPRFKSAITTENTGGTSSVVSGKPTTGWINCDQTNIYHYGMIMGGYLPVANTDNYPLYTVKATYYVDFRRVL